jgi:hypothetical protein
MYLIIYGWLLLIGWQYPKLGNSYPRPTKRPAMAGIFLLGLSEICAAIRPRFYLVAFILGLSCQGSILPCSCCPTDSWYPRLLLGLRAAQKPPKTAAVPSPRLPNKCLPSGWIKEAAVLGGAAPEEQQISENEHRQCLHLGLVGGMKEISWECLDQSGMTGLYSLVCHWLSKWLLGNTAPISSFICSPIIP